MADIEILHAKVETRFQSLYSKAIIANGELTLEVPAEHLNELCLALRDESDFDFKMLIDVCGVDYLQYGIDEWQTESATFTGFERGVKQFTDAGIHRPHRFASVYHLLSLSQNHRIRLRVFLDTENPEVSTVTMIWPAANWFEREAFDLFGIMYTDHPDLRRLLTDYGFVGHPFRKDFPLIGRVEARYDATAGRVIYEPVSIEPRILEPKVIRTDPRYEVAK
jgi:NADH-quinone oxidoreductase subunit C